MGIRDSLTIFAVFSIEGSAESSFRRDRWCSSLTRAHLSTRVGCLVVETLYLLAQKSKAFLQIQSRVHVGEIQTELNQGQGNLWLDSNDDGLGASEANHLRDVAKSACGKRIHHVQRGNIDDDAARATFAYLLDYGIPQLHEIRVAQCRLDRRNQEQPLLENRNLHSLPPYAGEGGGVPASLMSTIL